MVNTPRARPHMRRAHFTASNDNHSVVRRKFREQNKRIDRSASDVASTESGAAFRSRPAEIAVDADPWRRSSRHHCESRLGRPQSSPNTKAPTLRTLGLPPRIIVTSSSVTRGYDKKGLGKLGQWAGHSKCNETCNEKQRSNERVRQVAAFRPWTHTTLFASEFRRAMFP